MVLAGGPLRIYSSQDLKNWQVETTYKDLHTECPDLYPIVANDGALKWVLSRGGRSYKVGDFKQVDGKWAFVADDVYQDHDEIMNFGKDSYAAMTYYVHDFGTADHPNIPQLTEINWMNTWEDYCNLVADTVGQKFNGTFNLNLDLGLVKSGDSYLLTQTPVKAYESFVTQTMPSILKMSQWLLTMNCLKISKAILMKWFLTLYQARTRQQLDLIFALVMVKLLRSFTI